MDLRKRMQLPDFPFHFWGQSVARNIAIVLRLFDADGAGGERVLELLRDFDMLPLALRPVASLSRGQSYKAALVAMFAADRELLLLDEPFASGIDPHAIDAFKRHARAAARRGARSFTPRNCSMSPSGSRDRVCVMIHRGELRAFDTLDTLRERARDKDNVLEELFRQLREST